ncbi:calcium-activated chloride channel-domain-containing protein [Aspergillus granulosus]|uniref:Calcium-activated chloride channel-domain-containing protein n=1 Tax=Aspergillus granulosus TaxID=176169 RepID=A0ABR4HU74_9EURO
MSLTPNYRPADQAQLENFGVDWVVHYEFEDLDISKAIDEFESLLHDLHEANLETQVRPGHGASLLVFIRVPRAHLGNLVHQSRVKDWMYGIIHELPAGDEGTIVTAETPAEALRSVYHAVTWKQSLGGAHITPRHGKWKNIASAFPLHDQEANAELLRKWSRTILLTAEDLDSIRALFGEKVAFYFAFIQSYSSFLVFPAGWGIVSWWYWGSYSIPFAIGNCLWAIVFVEYWKIRETDLALRWQVNGVGVLKVTRAKYVWEKEIRDPNTGEIVQYFSPYRQFLRQLLLVPFASVASLALGGLIVVTFVLEVFISEVYTGSLKGYLEFLPTVIFSLFLPSISGLLTSIATRLTKYENYRTQDQYDVAQTTKQFVMHFITAFLPTALTAFVYVPFGAKLIPHLSLATLRGESPDLTRDFHIDAGRLKQEVIYLSLTGQVLDFGQEVVLPYVKQIALQKWRAYREQQATHRYKRRVSQATNQVLFDDPDESAFLTRVRNEAEAEEYNVHEDTLEMCVQFGYLTLFGASWPLVALGFLVNNWLELRGDFFKLSLEYQRPPPIRSDSIGPSLQGLEVLGWLGALSTAAIVYVYRDGMSEIRVSSLLLTLLLAEWAYLAMRFAVSTGLRKILSGTLQREAAKRYAMRKGYLEATSSSEGSPRGKLRVRFRDRVSVYTSATDPPSPQSDEMLHEPTLDSERRFWSGTSVLDDGVRIIRALGKTSQKTEKEL